MISDSILSDAGWLFFAFWTVILAAISIAAFGRDVLVCWSRLFPATQSSQTHRVVHSTQR